MYRRDSLLHMPYGQLFRRSLDTGRVRYCAERFVQHIRRSCGAKPPHKAGLNKPVAQHLRLLWSLSQYVGNKKKRARGRHAARHRLSSTRVPGFCGLCGAHTSVTFDTKKCQVDVLKGLTGLASPGQRLNILSIAGMGGLVNALERGRQRATAGAFNHRSPTCAVHARSCGPSPRRPGRSLCAERLVQQSLASDAQ